MKNSIEVLEKQFVDNIFGKKITFEIMQNEFWNHFDMPIINENNNMIFGFSNGKDITEIYEPDSKQWYTLNPNYLENKAGCMSYYISI